MSTDNTGEEIEPPTELYAYHATSSFANDISMPYLSYYAVRLGASFEQIAFWKSISKHINDLKDINLKLWDIEDGKRAAEKNQDFGEKFIELARNVYKYNDERAKIKLPINTTLGSNIKEVKSYE